MERIMKKIAAVFALVLLIVSLCFVPLGAICANAEEECPHKRKG